ncbi:LysR family transcriptional regulator [Micromonospora zingiberis]|uniref:LysR family transcriptional regulator n=1 Tax=Micromonospora zingiberis TaxID=2053011 RepID=A0A4R0GSN3_9ACTN|nr:LysR family transcriptional regulator [Micromonospora zingiberis]TCB99653.1 LysR family transcriptional regulator [Micromonospora zingiberis]
MHERELRAFALIAEIGRMDLAAKELGYSQPAVSYQIRCLEQSLGARLFNRDSTGARLTREGQMILPSVRALLVLIDNIKHMSDRSLRENEDRRPVVALRN